MKWFLIVAIALAGSVAFVAAQQCSSDEFTCDNGICIPDYWQCDAFNDCGDSSDERGCPCDDGFVCNSTGICIPGTWRCDYYDDCGDGSDEFECPCDDGFICSTGECIPPYARCDGYADCLDMGDEENCPSTTTTTPGPCWECADGSGCYPENYRCDQWVDCDDASDEMDCPCGDNEVRCDDGRCINSDYWCDGIVWDCNDGSDELDCDNSTVPIGRKIHRTGLDKVFKLTREGKLDKLKYQQKLRSQRNNKLRKSLGLKK